jgi:hypothetical protein
MAKSGRPRIYDSDADRQAAYRARKAAAPRAPQNELELLVRLPRRQQARNLGMSLRQWHYMAVFAERSKVKWSPALLNGRINKRFLADVARNATREQEREIRDAIRKGGAQAGYRIWDRIRYARRFGFLKEKPSNSGRLSR